MVVDPVIVEPVSTPEFPANREKNREFAKSPLRQRQKPQIIAFLPSDANSLFDRTGKYFHRTGNFAARSKRPFFTRLFRGPRTRSVLTGDFAGEEDKMSDELLSRARYGEPFWRSHHEAWRRSELNQREYCEVRGFRSRRSATGGRSSKPSRNRWNASCSTGAAG